MTRNPLIQKLLRIITVSGPFLLIAAAYLVAATREIELPGIYMDAVNPDYLVTRWLNPDAATIPAWIAPGNDIMGRYPLLVGLHHGSLQLWLGAPLFWIFGMSVIGLRLTHAMFAIAVLATWYALQRQSGLSRTWAVAFGVALAVDPSFVYAFRNQCYITMAPVALLMLAVIALSRARAVSGRARTGWLAGCGLLSGLACWGYFVYAFFVPALLVAAWLMPANPAGGLSRTKNVMVLGSGLAVGATLYLTGFVLLARKMGGFSEGIGYYLVAQPQLGIANASANFGERLAHVYDKIFMVIGNVWHHAMMFSTWGPTPGAKYKLFLLMGLPALLWLIAESRRCATPILRTVTGLQVSFIAGALFFGQSTNGHHYMPFVPLAYAGLAAAWGVFTDLRSRWHRPAGIAAAAVIVALLAINIVGNSREIEALRRTGGVGNFSDAINRFGAELYAGDHNRLLVLPDWGLFMPTAFLTRASMEMASHEDFELARRRLCEGKDVVLGLITGNRAERFTQWQTRLDWTGPQVSAYRQRDGQVVFEAAVFSGSDAALLCHQTQ